MVTSFRGVSVVRLSDMLHEAMAIGGLVLMKNASVRENIGKAPCLVLAEQLIEALQRPEEDG